MATREASADKATTKTPKSPGGTPKKTLILTSDKFSIRKSCKETLNPGISSPGGFKQIESLEAHYHQIKRITKERGIWCLSIVSKAPPVRAVNGKIISFPDEDIYLVVPLGSDEIKRNLFKEVFGYDYIN